MEVAGKPKEDGLAKLRSGLFIRSEGRRRAKTAPRQVVRNSRELHNPWYEVTLIEGKNRQIRRMFEEIGHHVEKIKRVRYGHLKLDVHPGKFRHLTQKEVTRLKSAVKIITKREDARAGSPAPVFLTAPVDQAGFQREPIWTHHQRSQRCNPALSIEPCGYYPDDHSIGVALQTRSNPRREFRGNSGRWRAN